MSYCRFSCDNFRSDVYVYESCGGGYVTHVADNRKIFPPIPRLSLRWYPRFGGKLLPGARTVTYPSKWHRMAANVFARIWHCSDRLHMWSVGKVPSGPIGLPDDGKSFSDDTIQECIATLIRLKHTGYHVPKHAFDRLLADWKDQE